MFIVLVVGVRSGMMMKVSLKKFRKKVSRKISIDIVIRKLYLLFGNEVSRCLI